jgi:cold shock CspA family protein
MSKYRAGIVHWFDINAGEGAIIDSHSGMSYYVHYSAIKSKEKFKKLSKGELVEFILYENLYMSQVDEVWTIKKTKRRNPEARA